MQELRCVIDEYPDRVLVGENDNVSYHGDGDNELHMVFNFPLMRTDRMTPAWIRANQKERLASLPPRAWPCNTLNNHDATRVYTRYRDGRHDDAIARAALALMLTLRGTPFLYNGEEIGMTDYRLTDINLFRDPPAVWFYNAVVADGMPPAQALVLAADLSRDRCRTPMQWSSEVNAGFSPKGVQTWLPVNPNFRNGINVRDQQNNPSSLLNYYKRLLQVRRGAPALVTGEYIPLNNTAREYFAFLRKASDQTVLVILNFSNKKLDLDFSHTKEIKGHELQILFPSAERLKTAKHPRGLAVSPFEVFIAEVAAKQ
jgi:alpha-glucosidase